MEIRYLSKEDSRYAVSTIYEEGWKFAYRGLLPQDYLNSIPLGGWASHIDTPGWNTLLCVEEDTFVGTCSFCRSRMEQYADSWEIISIYLLPAYIGKGYGKALLLKAMEEIKVRGGESVYLWMLEGNQRARDFYQHVGFSCTEDYLSDTIGGKDIREVRYTKIL